MKKLYAILKLCFLSICLFSESNAYAKIDCGLVPAQLELLQEKQLTYSQIEDLDNQIQDYFNNIEIYQNCIQSMIASLNPEADGYQIKFEEVNKFYNAAEEQKLMAIDRFNFHIENVKIESALPPEDAVPEMPTPDSELELSSALDTPVQD